MPSVITRRRLMALLTAGALVPATASRAAQLPERIPPAGFASVDGDGGGRALAGTFTGNARSAAAVLGGVVGQDAAATMRRTGEILRSAARGQSAAFDRANKGFGYYLRGVEVLEHGPSGRRGTFDRDFAGAVVKADPTRFRLVPPSQYRTTD